MYSNSGFTLVEVMITAALLGGLSLVLLNINKQQVTTQKKAETSLEMTSIHNSIATTLLNEAACLNTFGPVGNLSTATTFNVVRNRANNVVFNDTTVYNNTIQISSMKILNVVLTPPSAAFDAEFTYTRTSKIISGGTSTVTKIIPISVEINGSNTVTQCYSGSEDIVARACDTIDGVFNIITKKCDLTPYTAANHVGRKVSTAVSNEYLHDYVLSLDLPNTYVNVTGDTMTGPLIITNSNLSVNNAANRFVRVLTTNRFEVTGINSFLSNSDLTQTNGFITTNRTINADQEITAGRQITSGSYIEAATFLKAGTYVTVASDKRLKKNIADLGNLKDSIYSLHGVQFNWKKGGEKDYGFIAQEVEKVLPALVKTDLESGIKSVKYTNIIPFLVEELKSQRKENLQLKKETAILREEMEEIKSFLSQKNKSKL